MDYGAPVGFRLATSRPGRVQTLIIQNGNAYEEGLREFWDPIKAYWNDPTPEHADALRGLLTLDATKWQYTHGVRNTETISPDNWNVDQPLLDRPGNAEIQLAMFYDYRTNVPLYPRWQQYLRSYQPPTLIVWGANDPIFPAEGAHPYKRDLGPIDPWLQGQESVEQLDGHRATFSAASPPPDERIVVFHHSPEVRSPRP